MKPILALATALMITTAALPGFAETGTFTGASEHITTGDVSIVTMPSGQKIVIFDANFSLDGAPDPRVGFGKDGVYSDASDLGPLTQKEGLQIYIVPASVNIDDFNELYVWCKKFAVPLGVAALK